MNLKIKLIFSSLLIVLASGCTTYSTEDYAESDATKKKSLCVNMEPAQEMKCKEQEDSLYIGLGADENCNHPYEYERNRCKSEQAKKLKTLNESLKKHTGK